MATSGIGARIFDLPERLAHKADPALIASDEAHFGAVETCLRVSIAALTERLDTSRRVRSGANLDAMERDQDIHRVTARLRTLRRFGLDVCLGRMVGTDSSDGDPIYIGRTRLTDGAGRRLLVDWRSPAAAPFFAATTAHPLGLAGRRRYRWTRGRITDYWDEVLSPGAITGPVALDDDSAFLAGLGSSRSPRMRDVLGTLQADQDAIIRAGSRGALVVDGGPGTGKTVVALHRCAYLLYADPHVHPRRGGMLLVGPHGPYLSYIADVLPGLGEEGVQMCTLQDLVAEGAAVVGEPDPQVARLKASIEMVRAIDTAVRFHEQPPTGATVINTPWSELEIAAADWSASFAAAEPGTPHNEARTQVRDELVDQLLARDASDAEPEQLRRALRRHPELNRALNRAWPLVEAADLVADLWSVPAYLRLCAPWLTPEEVNRLQRRRSQAWTVADLPLLDAARRQLGDPEAERTRRRREAAEADQRERMAMVVDDLIAADDGEGLVTMLRQGDLRDVLGDGAALPHVETETDKLAGPFAHIVVDEAQELTDAQWQMLLSRCPAGSFTIVGDRAQARHGFAESWAQRLRRIGLDQSEVRRLTINYRTPEEVMARAEPVIRAVLPDANVPFSIRRGGRPVLEAAVADRDDVLATWLARNQDGIACVVGDTTFAASSRVSSLRPEMTKGLEFDLVVLVNPDTWGDGVAGAVDRYVAMTRTTGQLVLLR